MVDGTLIVVVGQQGEGRVGGIQFTNAGLAGEHGAFVVHVGEGGTVTIGDVEVELGDDLVVLFANGGGHATGIETKAVLRDGADLADLGISDAQGARADRGRDDIAGAFIGDGEEQAILDDRAGELRGVDLRFKRTGADHAAGIVAAQLVGVIIGARQEGKAVGTRL